MKLLNVTFENFLGYGKKQSLDLSEVDIACIIGENGAGKSSIFDAITWICWGKARINSADDLMHLGAENMMGALEFAMDEDRIFRITRRRKRDKSSMLTLDALSDGEWNNISGSTIRETQDIINDIIGMDYDLFVNTAFLAQGKADKFTTQLPSQRRKILGSILGLDPWNDYESKTKTTIKELKLKIAAIDARAGDMDALIGSTALVLLDLSNARKHLAVITADLDDASARKVNAEAAQARYGSAKQQAEEIRGRNQKHLRTIDETERELNQIRTSAGTVDEDKTRLAAMQAELEQMPDVDPDEIDNQTAILQDTRQKINTLEGENKAMLAIVDPIKAQIQRLTASPGGIEPLQKKINQINGLTDPVCPTCGQALSEEHKAATIEELKREIAEKQAENKRRIEELEQDVEAKREEYRLRQEEIKGMQTFLAPVEEELTLWKIQKEACNAKAKEIDQLQHKIELSKQSTIRIQDLEKRIEETATEIAEESTKLEEQQSIINELQETIAQTDAIRQEVVRLNEEKSQADRLVGAAQQKLDAIADAKTQMATLTDERAEIINQLNDYEELRIAFGKTGAPAMIIETVVPKIEQSANALLLAMTDDALSVRMETQSETKSGDTREALDIIVSDHLGARVYELYSGGEAFRINFAIRVALSKLLAHRAGAQNKALLIDEGFGSQDKKGRERLVSAINSVRDTFKPILAVTHIEPLKDAFPTWIKVEKTADGSVFRVE